MRPPIAHERLALRPDGRILVTLKIPWRDGTTHLCFEPIALLERLTADRLTRYHTKRLAALGYTVTLTKCAA